MSWKRQKNLYFKYFKQNLKPHILFPKKMEKIPKNTCMITCTKRQLATSQPLHILNTYLCRNEHTYSLYCTHYTVYIIHILQLIPNNPLTVLYILIIQNRDTLFFSHALNTKKINIILRGPIHLGEQPVWIYILINLES